jgi:2'-5' RNA ligase
MSKRLFLALSIRPNQKLKQQLNFLKANLSEEKINWIKENNFHLTLKFIGKTSAKAIPELIRAIQSGLKGHATFPIQLEKIGLFGSSYKARVIWLGVSDNKKLSDIHQQLALELEKVGYLSDRQNFVPHFTLGRIKKIIHKDHFKRVLERSEQGFIQETTIEQIELFESILTAEGPLYKSIKSFPLRAKPIE